MKITRENLRQLLREAGITQRASLSEIEVLRGLRQLSTEQGLPVTHEVPASGIHGVIQDRAVKGTYGIFFTVGHLKSPQFVIGPGYMIHGYIPLRHINSNVLYPDMRFVPENEDEFEDAWEVMLAEQRGNLLGLEISTNYDSWSSINWERIVDNTTGDIVWKAEYW
jgi:hypothetical protein